MILMPVRPACLEMDLLRLAAQSLTCGVQSLGDF
jgi:hypothetical protein